MQCLDSSVTEARGNVQLRRYHLESVGWVACCGTEIHSPVDSSSGDLHGLLNVTRGCSFVEPRCSHREQFCISCSAYECAGRWLLNPKVSLVLNYALHGSAQRKLLLFFFLPFLYFFANMGMTWQC